MLVYYTLDNSTKHYSEFKEQKDVTILKMFNTLLWPILLNKTFHSINNVSNTLLRFKEQTIARPHPYRRAIYFRLSTVQYCGSVSSITVHFMLENSKPTDNLLAYEMKTYHAKLNHHQSCFFLHLTTHIGQ